MAVCQRHWPENTKRMADLVRLWILRRFFMFQNPFANKLAVVSVRLFFIFYESLTVQHFFHFSPLTTRCDYDFALPFLSIVDKPRNVHDRKMMQNDATHISR